MAGIQVSFSTKLAEQLIPLFAEDRPIPIRLWAILDGTIEGRLIVDRPDAPTWALVQELAEGTTYIGGKPAPTVLAEAVERLRHFQDVVICYWPNALPAASLPPSPDYEGTAIDFTDRAQTVDLAQLAVAPAGYEVRRIEPSIVPLLDGYDYYVAMFGSVERALQRTIGYCILCGEEVVSEAVAGPFARGIVEIGVGTKAAHQGRRLATVVAAHTMRWCEASGFQPFWNASQHNVPSVALAERLGFRTQKPFRVSFWSKVGSDSVG